MKKTILVAGLTLLLATAPAMAQMMGPGQMMGGQQWGQGTQSTQQMKEQQIQPQPTPYGMYPGMMGGYGYGMGPQMMGNYGYGMGPGMMGGYGMGPQMMGGYGGYGMGPGMMGGYGMGPGMMGGYGHGMHHNMMGGGCYGMGPDMMGGYGYGMGPGMMGYYSPEQYEKQLKDQQEFLDATKELRKKMHDLKFDYAEALRNPKTEQKDLEKMNAEMENIWKQIYEKRESGAE